VGWMCDRFVGVWDADVVEKIRKPSQENLCIHRSLSKGAGGDSLRFTSAILYFSNTL
jgi:hypothetical protein